MAKINKYVSDFTIRLHSITCNGTLYPVQMSDAKSAKAQGKTAKIVSCTPDGRKVVQVSVPKDAPTSGEVFYKNQLESATEDPETGELTLIGKDNVEAAKESALPKNVLNLTVHEANEVATRTVSSDHKVYIFVPHDKDAANVQFGNLIRDLVERSGYAFMGQAVVKVSNEATYRLGIWNGYLTIERQVAPEQINDIPPADEGGVADSTYTKAVAAVTKMVTPFDPEQYRNRALDALTDLTDKALAGEIEPGEVVVTAAAESEFDIDAALEAFGEGL